MQKEVNIDKFNSDIRNNSGYLYTTGARISSNLSNSRISSAVRKTISITGKRVIDIGCGDGTYTAELMPENPAYLLGVDAASSAIDLANKRAAHLTSIEFRTLSVYELSNLNQRFDIAIVRGLLHHLYEVERAITEICKIADEIVVVEPNGYNPVLKIIEKTSSYHIQHEEKSYSPRSLDKWFKSNGGKIISSKYIGLVPFFCPDGAARLLKLLEPMTERTPVIRSIACGQYVQHIRMRSTSK